MAETTIIMPDGLLESIDHIAKAQQRTRSELLCEAAHLYMGERPKSHHWEDPVVLRAIVVMDRLAQQNRDTAWDPVQEIRRHRDANR